MAKGGPWLSMTRESRWSVYGCKGPVAHDTTASPRAKATPDPKYLVGREPGRIRGAVLSGHLRIDQGFGGTL